jgi:hypothetical protein
MEKKITAFKRLEHELSELIILHTLKMELLTPTVAEEPH